MTEGIIPARRKNILRLFTRSMGMLENLTYETPEELVAKFFPDKDTLVCTIVRDTTDEPVELFFDRIPKGELIALSVTQYLGPQRVMAPPPGARIPTN